MNRDGHGKGSGKGQLPPDAPTDPDSAPLAPGAPRARGARRGELWVRSGPVAGLRFPLRDGTITVGRSSRSDCPVHDEAISRRHFELQVSAEGVRLKDLGSGNGTRVNGERAEEVRLRHGDRIAVGNSVIEFRGLGAAEPEERAPARPRRRLLAGLGLTAIALAAAGVMLLQRRHQRQLRAEQAFVRGRAELAEDPPEPDLARIDFKLALDNYLDQRSLRDALVETESVAAGMQQLGQARELIDRKQFDQARAKLQGLPSGGYFERMSKAVSEEISQRETAERAEPKPATPVIRTLSEEPAKRARFRNAGPTSATHDDARASRLCDEADALLGSNPALARRKYREALKLARPGSEPAMRAEAGLE